MIDIDVDLDQVAVPLDWHQLFGRSAPVAVEIGAGKGRFLLEMAATYPDRSFLAVERAAKYHALVCARAARRGLGNVRLLRTSAEDLLFRLLAPASVAALYLLFPDPWPKRRHHKRRFVTPDNLAALARALQPGGQLLVKTDHDDYAAVIQEALATVRGLSLVAADAAFAGAPQTGFERKYLLAGRRIHAFALERTDAPG